MTTADTTAPESHTFEADVAKLLHLMVHSVYSDKDIFLRELISNAADAWEKLRYEAISTPALLGEDPKPRITLLIDAENRRLTLEDNGIGMSRDEMVEALGTIARSGTKAFMDRIQAAQGGEGAQLIGQFGVGFYSAFMVADRVDVISRRAGSEEATLWSSDGKGSYTIGAADNVDAPVRGTRVILHLMEDAASYTERYTLERIVKEQSGHVPVPIAIIEKPGAEPQEVADGAALWVKPRSEITIEEYTDFYRSVAGQFDEPALTVHFRAEGRHEYTALAFVPGSKPFDLFDPDRHGRMKLYVKRVFITDEAEILPRYLRFVRGLVDSADLPLNVSREMIQESPLLAAIKKGVTSRVLSELDKLAQNNAEAYAKIWDNFGPVLKEGIYEDFERRQTLLSLARFKTTASSVGWRSLKDYVGSFKENQTAIYYVTGSDLSRLEHSPQLEGFRARGSKCCCCRIRSIASGSPRHRFRGQAVQISHSRCSGPDTHTAGGGGRWLQGGSSGGSYELHHHSQGHARRGGLRRPCFRTATESAVCLVAPESGMDRQLERLLARAGQLPSAAKPVLEINPRHDLIVALANLGDDEQTLREDVAHLLLDEARVLDGELPADAKAFSQRLTRVMRRCAP
jgi:molecular chaperone HtpG